MSRGNSKDSVASGLHTSAEEGHEEANKLGGRSYAINAHEHVRVRGDRHVTNVTRQGRGSDTPRVASGEARNYTSPPRANVLIYGA